MAHVKTQCITSVNRLSAAFAGVMQVSNIVLQLTVILHCEYQSVSSACGKNRSSFEEAQQPYKRSVCRKLTVVSMELRVTALIYA